MARKVSWNDVIRRAVKASGLSLYRIAKDTELSVGPVQRFMAGDHGLTVSSAEKIGRLVGLELTPVQAKKKRRGR